MRITLVCLIVVMYCLFHASTSSRILVFLPISARSHKNCFEPLMQELSARKHEITFVTMYPLSKQISGIKTVFLESAFNKSVIMAPLAWQMSVQSSFTMLFKYSQMLDKICSLLYEDPVMADFFKNPGTYDVVLVNALFNDCFFSYVATFRIPIIMVSPSFLYTEMAWLLNVPQPWSYVPSPVLPFSSNMNFFQRVKNTLMNLFWISFRLYAMFPVNDAIIQKRFPDLPSTSDVVKDISLVLVNSHFSLEHPKPLMPYVVEVSAMHCRPAKALPEEFEKFIQGSGNDDGFIVFSMGSVVEGQYLPEHLTNAFQIAFSQIKHRVIWKYEKPLEGLSDNVMTSKWIPQQDLIGNPKCRLAITHGGLLSLQEVAYHGVPLLGVPIGFDRDGNIASAVEKGFVELIDWKTVTPEIILKKIRLILSNKSYKERAMEVSLLMKDRPQPPVKTAAYWVEYVIKHNGTGHMRSGAENLSFWQYFLLDVIAVLTIAVVFVLVLPLVIVTKVVRHLCRRNAVVQMTPSKEFKKTMKNSTDPLEEKIKQKVA